MKDWMRVLAAHYDQIRRQYPQDKLMIIFDIDGTIVDMRSMIQYVLQAFDHHHHTHSSLICTSPTLSQNGPNCPRTMKGKTCDLTRLIPERASPMRERGKRIKPDVKAMGDTEEKG